MTVLLPPVIRGESVTLRRWTIGYTNDLASIRDRSAVQLRTWLPEAFAELHDVDRFIATASARFDAGSEFDFAMFDASMALVGQCSMKAVDLRTAEIGYWICSD